MIVYILCEGSDELLSPSEKVRDRSQLINQLVHENIENLQDNPVI
jgi:hypothetical protein